MKIHPRYFIVVEAHVNLDMAVLRIEQKHDMDIEQLLDVLLRIALETNKVDACKDRKPLSGLSAAGKEILAVVEELERKHELTPAESIKNLLERATTINLHSIQIDRHHDDPNRKGDEA